MKKQYPMSVVLSATTGIMLTRIKMSAPLSVKDLLGHIRAYPEDVPRAIFLQHPELDVDTSRVTDWTAWVHDMEQRFGTTVEFDSVQKKDEPSSCTCRVVTTLQDGTRFLGGVDDCPVHGFKEES